MGVVRHTATVTLTLTGQLHNCCSPILGSTSTLHNRLWARAMPKGLGVTSNERSSFPCRTKGISLYPHFDMYPLTATTSGVQQMPEEKSQGTSALGAGRVASGRDSRLSEDRYARDEDMEGGLDEDWGHDVDIIELQRNVFGTRKPERNNGQGGAGRGKAKDPLSSPIVTKDSPAKDPPPEVTVTTADI